MVSARIPPVAVAIAAFTGIMLGTIILAVYVTFRTSTEFPILLGGMFILIVLIGLDYWQWVRGEK